LAGSLAGSLVGSGVVGLLGELVLPLAAPELLGWAAELELESLLFGEAALAPPEAEPDFGVSLEADPLVPADELDDEPGAVGLDEAPLDEGELLGEAVLEEPGVDEVLLVSPRSHAASPRASATATARMESFMCPPCVWIQKKKAASCAPDLTP
jgi:hypothetical protein